MSDHAVFRRYPNEHWEPTEEERQAANERLKKLKERGIFSGHLTDEEQRLALKVLGELDDGEQQRFENQHIVALAEARNWLAVFHTDKPWREDIPDTWTRRVVFWAADRRGRVDGFVVNGRGSLKRASGMPYFVRFDPVEGL